MIFSKKLRQSSLFFCPEPCSEAAIYGSGVPPPRQIPGYAYVSQLRFLCEAKLLQPIKTKGVLS